MVLAVQYRGKVLTLNNYSQILDKCDIDVLDEVQLAIMYDTQIGSYIDRCGTDWLKLSQIRRSLRALVPRKYISTGLSSECMAKFRELYLEGYNLEPFDKYLTAVKGVGTVSLLKDDKLFKLLDAYKLFRGVTKIDFKTINSNVFDTVLQGIKLGYPVWVITDADENLDSEMIQVMIKVMSMGVDVFYFLGKGYSAEQIALICSSVAKNDLEYFMSKINNHFRVDSLSVLVTLSKYKDALDKITVTDEDGLPVYNYYQMYQLGRCVLCGIDIAPILKDTISDYDMEQYFDKEYKKIKDSKKSLSFNGKSERVIGGRLIPLNSFVEQTTFS